ncbi:MAG: DnaB-like helicase C-terminal domain-containing protein [bacterium]
MSAQVTQLDDHREQQRRVPPHDAKAEEAVIGGCLIEPVMIDRARDLLRPDEFYRERHRRIFAALLDLVDHGDPVDLLTVADRLRARNELNDVGGASYLAELCERVPTGAHVAYYAQIVRRDADRRRAISVTTEIALEVHENGTPIAEYLPDRLTPLWDLLADGPRGSRSLSESVVATVSRLDDETEGRRPVGVSTGLYGLNEKLGGYCRGTFIVIAGRPSMGKSSLADTSILHEISDGHGVGLIALEQNTDRSIRRLIAKIAKVSIARMKKGKLSSEEMRRIHDAGEHLATLPLQIADDEQTRSDWTTVQVVARRMVNNGAEVIFIDHLGLLDMPARLPAQERVRLITRQMKRFAQQLDIPLVVLCQINREAAKPMRKTKSEPDQQRPGMHNLRDSGTIEQDADDIVLLHRPAYYDKSLDVSLCEAIVAKQRDGGVGTVDLRFTPETAQFTDYLQEGLPFNRT